MTRIIIVMSALLIVLVLLRTYKQKGAYLENFADGSNADLKINIYKAEWCGHCKKAVPEFKKLKDASPITLKSGKTAVVDIIDSDKDKDKVSKANIKGFPTIQIVKDGNVTEYPGERTHAGVIDFINSSF
jgi:thiol-disulfide isomerase/thioredoxin